MITVPYKVRFGQQLKPSTTLSGVRQPASGTNPSEESDCGVIDHGDGSFTIANSYNCAPPVHHVSSATCQCNCGSFQFIEHILTMLIFRSEVMPLVPEQFRTYPSSVHTPAIEQPGVFDNNSYFWGNTDDDHYRSHK